MKSTAVLISVSVHTARLAGTAGGSAAHEGFVTQHGKPEDGEDDAEDCVDDERRHADPERHATLSASSDMVARVARRRRAHWEEVK